MLDAYPSEVAVLDEAGVIVQLNALWKRSADNNGFAGGHYKVGKNYLDITAAEASGGHAEAAAVWKGIRQVMTGDLPEFSLTYQATPGRWFVVRAKRFGPVGAGDFVRTLVSHEDATAVTQALDSSRESEGWFSKAFHSNPQPMSITTLREGKYVNVNESFLERLGYRREEVLGRASLELGVWQSHRDRAHVVRLLRETGHARNLETRLRGKGGEERVWLSSAELIELRGEQCILVTSSDITERKRVDEKILELSGRLIRAQEEERSRIARELHDDLNQRLALLSIELEHLSQTPGPTTVEHRERTLHACALAQEISCDVRQMSHQLHPSKLDYLGLSAAVRGLCDEVSTRHGLRVEFTAREVPDDIPQSVALTLFRIAQESLRNVVRHSGASSARVELISRRRALCLRVTDSGAGFDVAAAKSKGGLGLLSIEERLRLVGGELVIRSRPSRGTQIEARIPSRRQTR